MTFSPLTSNQSRALAGRRAPGRRFLPLLIVGGAVGVVVGLGLYASKPIVVELLPVGLALLLPTLFLKSFRLYWFTLFLLTLQFNASKNLNEGLSVINDLKIDYTIQHFTFEITATDMALMVLLLIWINDRLFLRKPLRFPAISWLAVAYLIIAILSTLGAPSPYLGWVVVALQIKFFIVYLFAVNCLDSKGALRVLVVVGVTILVTQAAMTVTRYETGYMTPITLGETHQDEAQIEQYLTVDRSDPTSAVRAFGTLGSPGSTVRLCMMVIPFAIFLCVPNAMFRERMRLVFAALTAFALLGLALTFTRVYFITTIVQLLVAFLIILRDRMLKRDEVVLVVVLALAAVAAASPKLYAQFTVREDSQTVRFLQYDAALKMIEDHPILGVGLNNATGLKRKYSTMTYNKYDPNTQFYLEPTHNMYLSLASEIGVIGAMLFVAFFGAAGLEAYRQSRHSPDPEIKWAANALVVAFLGVAVNSLMDPLEETPVLVLLWLYAGISLNLSRMAQGPGPAPARAIARA